MIYPFCLNAQENQESSKIDFIVNPYLIKPGTDTMTIMFESVCMFPGVNYRKKGDTEFKTTPAGFIPFLPTLRKAKITGLESDTVYEYFVSTPLRRSKTYSFKTWPLDTDNVEKINLAAISDSQGGYPDRLKDVNVNGILKKEADLDLNKACEKISAIFVTGDLVTTASDKNQWVSEFFKNMDPLASYVPIIPALGNHDIQPFYYSCYFDLLPDLTLDLKISTFYNRYDILNTSILTLNSNKFFSGDESDIEDSIQRMWVEEQLRQIADDDSKKFMIAQFHHPCKSEIWPPGNSERSCSYVKKFEEFTDKSKKPSIHLFGHTHAYSRGQSKNVTHLWVNVATTAGSIDYWGEYDSIDYEMFQKSVDEYGYCMLTITQNQKPHIKFVRRSGGDGIYYNGYSDDTITDTFYITYDNNLPDTPFINADSKPGEINFSGTAFSDSDKDTHLETNWQIAVDKNFENIAKDIWGNKTRCENIWYDDNIQSGVDITKFKVNDLEKGKTYFSRVRYRDSRFGWSKWSDYVEFQTK